MAESVIRGTLFECKRGSFSAGETGLENEVEKILFPGLEKNGKGGYGYAGKRRK